MKAGGISLHVIGLIIAVTTVTAAPAARAAVYPTNTCVSAKMAAAATYCQSTLNAWSASETTPSHIPTATNAATKLETAWQTAETKATNKHADCADTTLSSSELQSLVDTAVTGIVSSINDGLNLGNPAHARCGKKLLAAAANNCAGLLNADARHIVRLGTDTTGVALAAAKSRARGTFTGAWFAATAQSCPTTATKSSVQGQVDALDRQVVMDTTVSPNVDISKFITIAPSNPTTYLGRQYAPECMDGSTYSFFVKRGSVNKLVMYYQGGGACWDQTTCGLPTCDTTVDPSDNPNNQHSGFADLTNTDNPFNDWNIVFVAYCGCDIHYGDAEQDYANSDPAHPLHVVHHGFHNAKVAEKWAREHFVNPEMVFVTGSSAGAYGAVFNAPLLHKVWPASQFRVLGDAGNGVITADFLQNEFNNWNFTANLPPYIPGVVQSITSGMGMVAYIEAVASYFPNTLWAHYATAFDGGTGGQTGFYNIMLNGIGNLLTWWNASCAFNTNMVNQATTTAADIALENDNYRYYIGSGSRHTMWGDNKVYTDTTGISPPITIVDWINAMLIGGPGWGNFKASPGNELLTGDPQPSPLVHPFEVSGPNIVVKCP